MICSGDLIGINTISDGEHMRYTTPTQSIEARERKRQRNKEYHSNMTTEQKKAKKDREKARRALLQNTLGSKSIAKKNPMYNQIDVVLPFTSNTLPVGRRINVDFSTPVVGEW